MKSFLTKLGWNLWFQMTFNAELLFGIGMMIIGCYLAQCSFLWQTELGQQRMLIHPLLHASGILTLTFPATLLFIRNTWRHPNHPDSSLTLSFIVSYLLAGYYSSGQSYFGASTILWMFIGAIAIWSIVLNISEKRTSAP